MDRICNSTGFVINNKLVSTFQIVLDSNRLKFLGYRNDEIFEEGWNGQAYQTPCLDQGICQQYEVFYQLHLLLYSTNC